MTSEESKTKREEYQEQDIMHIRTSSGYLEMDK